MDADSIALNEKMEKPSRLRDFLKVCMVWPETSLFPRPLVSTSSYFMRSLLSSLIKANGKKSQFLASIRGDLANITAPPFFLAPLSVVEVGTCWTERPSLFAAPTLEPCPERRSLLILKWILVSLKAQFYIGGSPSTGIKKPLNAFLGEIFIGSWMDATATSHFVAEQVSHHPPITAVYMWDDEHGIRGEGYTRVEMTFSGSVDVQQTGHAVVHIDRYDEDFLIPLPNAKVKGFLSGRMYPELGGTCHIISSTGFISEIRFSGQGFLRGERNSVEATMYRRGDDANTPLYSVSGQWSDKFTIWDCRTGQIIETYDTNAEVNLPAKLCLANLEDQDPWESRRAWEGVISALKSGNFGETVDEKMKIEKAQREMRILETRKGQVWQPLLFSPLQGEYDLFSRLGSATGWELQGEKTKGVWKVDAKKAMTLRSRSPFRGDLTPLG